jgi:anaerobic magnesium-protoporphyrin IX monomethyl ester cyclase
MVSENMPEIASKKKTLFAPGYFYRLDTKQLSGHQPFPPLGTLYAASYTRLSGYDVRLYDTHLSVGPKSLEKPLQVHQPDFLIIYDDGFNYLTKMCLTNMREACFEMIRMGKAEAAIVIVCSSDSTDHYEKYLDEGADFIVRGEGEQTLLLLLNSIRDEQDIQSIDGIAFRKGAETHISPKRAVMKDLDAMPLPAWDLININQYKAVWELQKSPFHLNVASTRGCPYKCNWCAKPIYGNRYNVRSPEHVVDEIEFLIKNFDTHHFWFCDDIFGLKPGWIKSFAEVVQKRGLSFKYKIQSRVDLLQDEAEVESFVKSGLAEVWLGVESGSQKILDAMDKGITVAQVERASSLLKAHGVKVCFFIQLGYLGETIADVIKTCRVILKLMPHELGISVSYPLPGTKFYDKVKEDMKLKTNWTDSGDLDMMFQNIYPPKYYKALHAFIHMLFRTKKSWIGFVDSPMRFQKSLFINFLKLGYHAGHCSLTFFEVLIRLSGKTMNSNTLRDAKS